MTAAAAPTASSAAPPRPNGGLAGLVALVTWTELRASARNAEFAIGAVGIPLLLYVMFGLTNPTALAAGSTLRTAMLVSLSAYGVVSLAIFSFGENLARERGRGWARTLRASPLPTGVHLLGKAGAAVAHAALIVAAMGALAATAGQVGLPATSWIGFGATMLGGVLVFSPLGFAIALTVRPRAAVVVANLIFLPLAFCSGFFVPLSELPAVMRTIAPWLPTFHFGQLAYRTVMPAEDVEDLTGIATRPVAVSLAWVVLTTVALAALALVAARREAVTRRG